MKKVNILFMGTPEIAVAMLSRLLEDKYRIVGVVTQPDKKIGRKQLLTMPPVKELALAHDIPVYQPGSIKEEYEQLMELDIDVLITCAYGQFIPKALLEYPKFGSFNVHTSLLPKLRGGAPIHRAIMTGESFSGVSIQRMVEKMDAGAVCAQQKVEITQEDTMGTLYDKLAQVGADLLAKTLPKIINNEACFVEQREEEATFAYNITKEEELVDFECDVQTVYNHIRALIPQPCAYAYVHQKKLKFHKARMIRDNQPHVCGQIEGLIDQGIAIGAMNGYVLIDELQMEGKAKTDAKSFYNGIGKNLIGYIINSEQ